MNNGIVKMLLKLKKEIKPDMGFGELGLLYIS
jgi:hypothetical protein